MYKNLLVPIDDTLLGAELVGEVVELANAWQARITFFHGMPDEGSIFGDAGLLHAMAPIQYKQKYQWSRRTVLARAQVAAKAVGVDSTGVSRPIHGALHREIIGAAQEFDCDLIAVTTHGSRGTFGLLHESTGTKLLTDSPIPVLFVVTGGAESAPMRRALALIRDEHRSLGAVVQGLLNHLEMTRSSRDALDPELVGAALRYLGEFSGRLHHAKEELYLFPKLRARGPQLAERLDGLCAEHVHEAELLEAAQALLARTESAGADATSELVSVIEALAKHVWWHMTVEETVVLPAARAVLTPEDWQEIEAGFADRQEPPAGHDSEEQLQLMFARLANLMPQ